MHRPVIIFLILTQPYFVASFFSHTRETYLFYACKNQKSNSQMLTDLQD